MTDNAFGTGTSPPPGDRNIVTVLFADVVSSTKLTAGLDPDDIGEIMDHATSVMANAVRTYDGSVVRFQGDGIEAVFGAPRPAEDHALRACLAGLAIQEAFAANPFAKYAGIAQLKDLAQVRVGIHSGLVIARDEQRSWPRHRSAGRDRVAGGARREDLPSQRSDSHSSDSGARLTLSGYGAA